jgi:hypothetical protein
MTIKELAKLMGVTEGDVVAFVACLQVWLAKGLAKGLTLEQAISRHMDQMERLAGGCLKLPKSLVVDTFFPAAA